MVREYGYEYDAVLNEDLWLRTGGKTTSKRINGAYCLRSGRDALKAIAREYPASNILMPALSCDSMYFPFELYGHKVSFYKLNYDYSIDMIDLKRKISSGPVLFLYMDYFGHTSITDGELGELRKNYSGLVFIEDCTHVLDRKRNSEFDPDYIVASIRKWLAIPDGGLLWGRITRSFNRDTSFYEIRLKAQIMRNKFLQTGDISLKEEYRRIFSTVSSIMEQDAPSEMSEYSYFIINNTDLEKIYYQRKKNAAVLSAVLSPYVTLIQPNSNLCSLYVPFLVPNRDIVQKKLSRMGIFNTIIWPLGNRQKEICATSKYTVENMLAAPCDQRYTEVDMEYIGKKIIEVIEDINGKDNNDIRR